MTTAAVRLLRLWRMMFCPNCGERYYTDSSLCKAEGCRTELKRFKYLLACDICGREKLTVEDARCTRLTAKEKGHIERCMGLMSHPRKSAG